MRTLILLSTILLVSCSSHDKTVDALNKAGYSEPKTFGHAWGYCGEDDVYSTEFGAVNPAGKYVTGVVCCGHFKGCTIRF